MDDHAAADAGKLGDIDHFVVLMLENRSFDHLLGSLTAQNPAVAGGDPAPPAGAFAMPFDPGHEFADVQIQLFGRGPGAARSAGPRIDPAPMSGFVVSAQNAAKNPSHAAMVMQSFRPARLPALASLAREFAVVNFWHASMPGPTWPNRFFVHAATSGGLSDSPNEADILAGYTFPSGTVYQRLEAAGKSWRIYHDGLPQSAGIASLRTEFLDIFTTKFREMRFFEDDLRAGTLPEYVFIEPHYDTGHQFVGGNSMHPLNDVRKGEQLINQVYQAIRASRFWANTLLIVTFDEHGGFFDHVPPPAAAPPGGDQRYADPANHFAFDRLGVRVPAIVVSAFTQKSTVIGSSPQDSYDHTSILATVEKRFALTPITRRDAAARTLDGALNLSGPRVSGTDAPLSLPRPPADSPWVWLLNLFRRSTVDPTAPLSKTQKAQLALAHACNLQILEPAARPEAHRRYQAIHGQHDAANYLSEVEERIRSRRRS